MTPRRVFTLILWLTVAVNAAILVARILGALRFSALIPIPIEGPGLYAIWKVQHGYPLSEIPTRPFFGLTLYNFLFYESYARLLSIAGVTDRALPAGAQLLTLAFAAAGVVAHVAATRAALRRFAVVHSRGLVLGAALLVWFGVGIVGRFAVAARPDVAALAAAVAALAIVLGSIDRTGLAPLVAASVMFFVAWAFKQSVVGMFAGVCLFECLVRRSIVRLAAFVAPFAVLAALAIALGGPAYRFNLLEAPRIAEFSIPWFAVYWYRSMIVPNLPMWIAAAAGLVWCWRARAVAGSPWSDPALTLLVCAMATTFPLAAVLLAKPGSIVNHTFESCAVAAIFAVVSFLVMAERASESARRSYTAGAVLMCVPLVYAALVLNRGPVLAIRAMTSLKTADPLVIGSREEYARRTAMASRLATLPKPIFIDDEMLAQPWFANDNRYPAVVIDRVFYGAAEHGGYLERDGVLSLVDDRYFASLVVSQPPWLWSRRALAAGYVSAGPMPGAEDLKIFIRSDTAPRKPFQSRRPTSRRTP